MTMKNRLRVAKPGKAIGSEPSGGLVRICSDMLGYARITKAMLAQAIRLGRLFKPLQFALKGIRPAAFRRLTPLNAAYFFCAGSNFGLALLAGVILCQSGTVARAADAYYTNPVIPGDHP